MEITSHPYSLEEGEQLLWHGGTRESPWLPIWLMAPGLLIGLMKIFDNHEPILLRLAFLALGLISLLILTWRLWPRGRIMTWRKQWMYRVTNRRVVVQGARGIFGSILHNVPLSDIGDLNVSFERNGLGTVVIGHSKAARTLLDGTRVLGKLVYVSLNTIANPREVIALIESAKKNAVSSAC